MEAEKFSPEGRGTLTTAKQDCSFFCFLQCQRPHLLSSLIDNLARCKCQKKEGFNVIVVSVICIGTAVTVTG